MMESGKTYPAYSSKDARLLSRKALLALDFEQIQEIANVFYYVNKKRPLFGGLRLDEAGRALHKSIHDAAVNCALSLEEAERCAKEEAKNG